MSYTSSLGALARRSTPTIAIKRPGGVMAPRPPINDKLPPGLSKVISPPALISRRMPVSSPPNKWTPGVKGRPLPKPRKEIPAVFKVPSRLPGSVSTDAPASETRGTRLVSHPTSPSPDAGIIPGDPPPTARRELVKKGVYSPAYNPPARPAPPRPAPPPPSPPRVAPQPRSVVDQIHSDAADEFNELPSKKEVSKTALVVGGAVILGAVLLLSR